MGVSLIGLILVALVGMLILAGLVFVVIWFVKSAGSIRPGHAMLACPHCSAETPANLEKCQKCGQELR
ncbi:MAG: hypothetical protein ACM3U2_05880 [Deltaproteobacteria bacterium]